MDININKNEFEGAGKERVVEKVRNVTETDIKRIWEIRNNPSARENSNNPEEIPLDKHIEWMKKRYFTNSGNYCFVLDFSDKVIGYCRFDHDDNGYLTSIAIDPEYTGRGLGGILLSGALKELKADKDVFAEIKLSNQPSLKLFQKNGFIIYKTNDRENYLVLKR